MKKRRPTPVDRNPSGAGKRLIDAVPVSRQAAPPVPKVADINIRCLALAKGA